MFSQTQFLTLFAYHFHTNHRLLDCTVKLDEADYRAKPDPAQRSIHETFRHLLRTDMTWRLGLETGKQLDPVKREDFPDLASLQAGFAAEQVAWQALLDRLSAAEIEGTFDMTNWDGEAIQMVRWRIMQHVILHGMQHHSELAYLLTAKGQSPGDLDFIDYE